MVRLHNEIVSFASLASVNDAERVARREAVSVVRRVCRETWPACEVRVFGSEVTGLALFCSDIDLVVFGASGDKLQTLRSRLEGFASRVEAIENATVPIVKGVIDGVSIDISFDTDSGIRMSEVAKEALASMPCLRPLVVVIKYFLAQRVLNQPYNGGLGSFATFLTVVSFLQHRHRVDVATQLPSPANLGCLLVEYFELYGRDLNLARTALSIRSNGRYCDKVQFHKHAKSPSSRPASTLLAIENPLDPRLDVTNCAFNMPRIRRAFNHAYRALNHAARHSNASLLAGTVWLVVVVVVTIVDTRRRVVRVVFAGVATAAVVCAAAASVAWRQESVGGIELFFDRAACGDYADDEVYTNATCSGCDLSACNTHCQSGWCYFLCGDSCDRSEGAGCAMQTLDKLDSICETVDWSNEVPGSFERSGADLFGTNVCEGGNYGCDKHIYCSACGLQCQGLLAKYRGLEDTHGMGPRALQLLNDLSVLCQDRA
ncbi:hypothetical protein CTAYLR_010790 [Chrysophaeum taylorii]|uniref:Uncharacterized protein n=1 Tax=Chrysophaeum taylorii TaxID=2483200 RepID=A0AAD7XG79_9STRA|nr:hypothetical protein CTAYLR_010790 [Chrysophaeum taylorii]